MAKKKTEKEYQEWMEDVLGKTPEALAPAMKSVLEAPAGMELFNGHLREREFYRRLSEVDEARKAIETERQALGNDVANLESWYKSEVPKFESMKAERNRLRAERDTLRSQLEELGLSEPTPGGQNVKTDKTETNDELFNEVKRLNGIVAQMDATVPVFFAEMGSVLKRAIKEDYDIDPKQLVEHATSKTGSLTRSFEELTADQRKEREEAKFKAEIEKAKEEARREVLAQSGTPERLRPSGPTVADAIRNGAAQTPDARIASAVDAWNKALNENPNALSF